MNNMVKWETKDEVHLTLCLKHSFQILHDCQFVSTYLLQAISFLLNNFLVSTTRMWMLAGHLLNVHERRCHRKNFFLFLEDFQSIKNETEQQH